MQPSTIRIASVTAVLLCVYSFSSAQVDLKTCGNDNSDITCSFFFRKVDQAFRQRDILYTLRKSFFPTEGARPILFDTSMTLEIVNVPDILCKDEDYVFGNNLVSNAPVISEVCEMYECGPHTLQWKHQWSKTILTYIIEREDLELLQDTSFVAFSAATFNSFDTSVFSADDDGLTDNATNSSGLSLAGSLTVQFLLTIDFLPCRPDDDVLLEAWEDILPWLELYSMNSDNLENVEYTQEGRGYAFREGRTRRGGITVPMLSIIHILINVVFALAATYFLYKYHGELHQVKGKQYQLVASMYWAVVIMCLIGAVVIIVGNCYLYYALLFIDDRSPNVFGFRIASDVTVATLAVVELLVSMLTPHNPAFFIPHVIRRTLCCNQCCRCCGNDNRRNILRRCILGVAMWIIILFLQLIISSILPLAVVIITNPVPSLAYVSLLTALFFCLVVFVAYFLNTFEGNYIARHRLSKEERRKSSIPLGSLVRDSRLVGNFFREKLVLVAQAFVFLVIFVIVALVIILYLNFVRAGANTNTVGGLFFSLVPSVVLGGITWAAKKHLFKELEEEEEDDDNNGEGNGAKEASDESKQTVIKIGGFSWHRSSTKRKKMANGNITSKTALVSADAQDDEDTTHAQNGSDTVIDMDDETYDNTHMTADRKDEPEGTEGTDISEEKRVSISEAVREKEMTEKDRVKKEISLDMQEVQVPFMKSASSLSVLDSNDPSTI